MKKLIKNIKNIRNIIFLFSGILCSCNGLLDLQNDGRVTMEEVFTTRDGVRGYLNACYNYRPVPTHERSSLCDDSQDADDMYANSRYSFWYGNAYSVASFSASDGNPWASYYEGIRKCNVFIAKMSGVAPNTINASQGELSGWIAQARTLRALYYLQLIKRYGEVPLLTEPYTVTHDYSADRRTPVSDVVAQILKDCDDALTAPDIELGFAWTLLSGQSGIMTRAVAHAIKSQAITYACSPLFDDGVYTWADATRINAEALYQCTTNGYELFRDVPAAEMAQNAYALYFITRPDEMRAYDKETIYGANNVDIWRQSGLLSTPGQEKAGVCPTQELIDSYEMEANGEPPFLGYADEQHLNPILNPAANYDPDNPYDGRDPRFYASVYYNGAPRNLSGTVIEVETFVGGEDGISVNDRRTTRTGYYLRKYNNWRSNRDNLADGAVRLFRLAEIYLNFAESAYQSHGPDVVVNIDGRVFMSARDAVGEVRSRAGMLPFPAGMSNDDFEKKYRNERRIELAFEEHRFFDVRRWQILDETERYVTGMRITRQGANLNYERIVFERGSWLPKYYLYPVPQSEVNIMQGHTGINWQNPGWN